MIIYTSLFGHYEELKEPSIITPGWRYICFTDQPLKSNTWEIIHTPAFPSDNPQLAARWYKIMGAVDYEKSIWMDAAFKINVNLNDWWEKHFKAPFSAPIHPHRDCVYHEILSCKLSYRAPEGLLEATRIEYLKAGIPKNNGIIASGILLRDNSTQCIELCEAWWHELSTHTNRDQIAFARVSIGRQFSTFQYDYTRGHDFEYYKHFKYR